MRLRALLQQQEQPLAQRWLEQTLASYPSEGARFMAKQKDRFANPVGHSMRTGIADVLHKWLAGAPAGELAATMEPMIRVRSVQSFSPGQAVAFVFLLKGVVRAELAARRADAPTEDDLLEVDGEVDRLALVAFDVYTRCRDQVHELRVDEVKRRVSGLLRRVGWGDDAPPDAGDGSAEAPEGSSTS
jgi:hypothetical protein